MPYDDLTFEERRDFWNTQFKRLAEEHRVSIGFVHRTVLLLMMKHGGVMKLSQLDSALASRMKVAN